MKLRCEPVPNRDYCKRCARMNRQCLISAPARRRQKTVHRVAELEKKIEALTSSLHALNGPGDYGPAPGEGPDERPPQLTDQQKAHSYITSDMKSIMFPNRDAAGLPGSDAHLDFTPSIEIEDYVDVIDRGIIHDELAYQVFDKYHSQLCRFIPIVVFPADVKAETMRHEKPMLFLAILAAASSAFQPELQLFLGDEFNQQIAQRVAFRGERSLELIQAMQVFILWYNGPRSRKELNFNQLIQMAATMAWDLGMGKRSRISVFQEKPLFPGSSTVEIRRTWLGCYYMCAR